MRHALLILSLIGLLVPSALAQTELSPQPRALAIGVGPTLGFVSARGSTDQSRLYGGGLEVASSRFGVGVSLGRYADDTGPESTWATTATAYLGGGRLAQTVPALSLSLGSVNLGSGDAVWLFSPSFAVSRRIPASPSADVMPHLSVAGVVPVGLDTRGLSPQAVVSVGLGFGAGAGGTRFAVVPTASYASDGDGGRGVSIGGTIGIVSGVGR